MAPVQLAYDLRDIFDTARDEIVIVSVYLIPTPALEGAVDEAMAHAFSLGRLMPGNPDVQRLVIRLGSE